MEHGRKLLVIHILLSSLVILSKAEFIIDPICYDQKNSTRFQENLNSLLSILNNASSTTRFYNATSGSDPDQVFGLFFCRYDLPLSTCRDCIARSTTDLLSYCQGYIKALSFYTECTLRYADIPAFSQLDFLFHSYSCDKPSLDDPALNKTLQGAFLGLIDTAIAGANTHNGYYFATGEQTYLLYQTFYAMVQCSPDTTPSDCRTCLTNSMHNALSDCEVSVGAASMIGSCSVLYSFYPFYNTTNMNGNVSLPPQHTLPYSPPSPTGNPRSSSPTLIRPDTFSMSMIWVVLLLGEILPIIMPLGQRRNIL